MLVCAELAVEFEFRLDTFEGCGPPQEAAKMTQARSEAAVNNFRIRYNSRSEIFVRR
jgi:hypothetical protein